MNSDTARKINWFENGRAGKVGNLFEIQIADTSSKKVFNIQISMWDSLVLDSDYDIHADEGESPQTIAQGLIDSIFEQLKQIER